MKHFDNNQREIKNKRWVGSGYDAEAGEFQNLLGNCQLGIILNRFSNQTISTVGVEILVV